ncbi:MAG: TM0106 family RecB-like putative nuclease [SAR202 cluster bacterium]|jgi:predicted RecB family nuclease|nr:TM0106 family RecB-like putative nuclease [SAR202 cluster bacterium]|tara:strand:+ start:353 stop:3106 length:2754 start_codon:yes stop_codon:yes gene_type:complete
MKQLITSDLVISYIECPRKAYIMLCEGKKGTQNDFISILEVKTRKNRTEHFDKIQMTVPEVKNYSPTLMKKGKPYLIKANLEFEDYKAYADALKKTEEVSLNGTPLYSPVLIVGTHKISKKQKFHLAFIAFVLAKIQNEKSKQGTIIGLVNKSHKIGLNSFYKEIVLVLKDLHSWRNISISESPPLILNKHCALCQFKKVCRDQAVKIDHLSLLNNISTLKQYRKYERKGIFTVNQLSYLYRPRKQRKRSRNSPAIKHSLELQALVLRTGKTYLHKPPQIQRKQTELFLDIEGNPDTQSFYLIGILICEEENSMYYSFWADATDNEIRIWRQVFNLLKKYPNCPIYHYGNYDAKALATLGKRYGIEIKIISEQLININTLIYGKVYFPLYSNSLKEIGEFIGARWSFPDPSGLQTLIWRYHWEKTKILKYKNQLIAYNKEDCMALKMLTEFLTVVKENEDSILDIDCFVHSKKSQNTLTKNPLNQQLEAILKFSHARSNYNRHKIIYSDRKVTESNSKRITKIPSRKNIHGRITRTKQIHAPEECTKCGKSSQKSRKKTQKIKIDLIFNHNGVRKTVTKYVHEHNYCKSCRIHFKSPELSSIGRFRKYGDGFKTWVVYQRIALRLSYRRIALTIQDMFNVSVSDKHLILWIKDVAKDYSSTEENIIKKLLLSPFLHVDETQINVNSINQYAWVFTDRRHVIFKYTETREASFVQNFLKEYEGILISDFYTGFDVINCKHQKCLVHLIRDLNNDLWANPFDLELDNFVFEIKCLIVPIMETIQKYGLKKRNLNKFRMKVELFYIKKISNNIYKSALCQKYQTRFINYRKSLFTFLEYNDILWHNNPAENALRHITLQSDVSRIFYKSMIEDYLLLLGIRQTCKFQNKSFLRFILSNKKDVDIFKSTSSSNHFLGPKWD